MVHFLSPVCGWGLYERRVRDKAPFLTDASEEHRVSERVARRLYKTLSSRDVPGARPSRKYSYFDCLAVLGWFSAMGFSSVRKTKGREGFVVSDLYGDSWPTASEWLAAIRRARQVRAGHVFPATLSRMRMRPWVDPNEASRGSTPIVRVLP